MTNRQTSLQDLLLAWFRSHGRALPWRRTRDPYAVLVAEVMLQQTQVDRVVPKYLAFLDRFPTLEALAESSTADVIRQWVGLGYNRRALYLLRAARAAVHAGGVLPSDPRDLRKLDGIGPYTAAAVACFAFGHQAPVVDTNVRRVLGRVFGGAEGLADKALAAVAQSALPQGQAWAWNQALMDLGATVCVQREPRCNLCPVSSHCRAAPGFRHRQKRVVEARPPYRAATTPFRDSSRYYRGRIIAYLRGLPAGASADLADLGAHLKPSFDADDLPWLRQLVEGLQRDGLVSLRNLQTSASAPLRVSLPPG